MSKRLILVLTLAFVVGISFAAYAEVQNVKVGGDIAVMGLVRETSLTNTNQVADADKTETFLGITRLRVDADLTDNVMATVRLLNERYYGSQEESTVNSDIDLDLAFVTLKEFLYSPLTVTLGRQELRFGNAMIIGDPDTNNRVAVGLAGDPDLSVRKAFDAVRLNLNYDPLIIDVIASEIDENTQNLGDDIMLYGVNAAYALDKDTMLEGYIFSKYTGREQTTSPRKIDRVDTVGARVVTSLTDKLTYQLEAAYQFGKRVNTAEAQLPTASRRAWALETALTMDLRDAKLAPMLTACYAYYSGQKRDDRDVYKAWDPMFEDQTSGHIANAQFDQSNAHVLGAIAEVKPKDDLTLKGEYYVYWWDKIYSNGQVITSRRGDSFVMTDNKFAGQELDLTATYDYTEDVQLSLMTGLFIPGKSFHSTASPSTQSEVIGSMKVTF
jgi:hypothetical protein